MILFVLKMTSCPERSWLDDHLSLKDRNVVKTVWWSLSKIISFLYLLFWVRDDFWHVQNSTGIWTQGILVSALLWRLVDLLKTQNIESPFCGRHMTPKRRHVTYFVVALGAPSQRRAQAFKHLMITLSLSSGLSRKGVLVGRGLIASNATELFFPYALALGSDKFLYISTFFGNIFRAPSEGNVKKRDVHCIASSPYFTVGISFYL